MKQLCTYPAHIQPMRCYLTVLKFTKYQMLSLPTTDTREPPSRTQFSIRIDCCGGSSWYVGAFSKILLSRPRTSKDPPELHNNPKNPAYNFMSRSFGRCRRRVLNE